MSRRPPRRWLALVGEALGLSLLGALLLLPGLGGMGALESTDARYLEISREMYETGDYLTPRLASIPHLDKPPLAYWATCLGFRIAGVTPLGGRLLDQAALLGTALVVFLHARRFLGRSAASVAALIVLTAPLAYGTSRSLSTDLFQLLLLTGAMILLHEGTLAPGSSARVALGLALLGLSMLVKGPIAALVVVAVLVAYRLLCREALRMPWRGLALGLLLLLAIGLPWYLMVPIEGASRFGYFLGDQLLGRVTGGGLGHAHRPTYFLELWPLLLFPWTPVVALSIWRVASARETRSAPRDLHAVTWATVPVFLFSLFATKLPTYVLPIVPGTALTVARACAAGRLDDRWGRRAVVAAALSVALGAATVGTLLFLLDAVARFLPPGLDPTRFVAPEAHAAALLGVALAVPVSLRLLRSASGALIGVGLGLAATAALGFSAVSPGLPSMREPAAMVAAVPGAELIQFGVFRAGLLFHAGGGERSHLAEVAHVCDPLGGRRTPACLDPREAFDLLRGEAPAFVLTDPKQERLIEDEVDAVAVFRSPKHVLLANRSANAALPR